MKRKATDPLEIAYKRGLKEYQASPIGKGRSSQNWGISRAYTLAKKSDGSKDKDLFDAIPDPTPPRLHTQAISLDTVTTWVSQINDAMIDAGLAPLRLEVCGLADKDNKQDPRVFAHTNHKDRVICVSKAWLHLPIDHAFGVLVHEAGHEAAFQAWDNYDEEAADVACLELLGWEIRYKPPSLLQIAKRR